MTTTTQSRDENWRRVHTCLMALLLVGLVVLGFAPAPYNAIGALPVAFIMPSFLIWLVNVAKQRSGTKRVRAQEQTLEHRLSVESGHATARYVSGSLLLVVSVWLAIQGGSGIMVAVVGTVGAALISMTPDALDAP